MEATGLFTAALGLQAPWEVEEVRFTPEQGEIHFDVGFAARRLACPACGADGQPIHDRKARSWQHLHFFQYRAFLHAAVPRVRCTACCKTTQFPVPWARPGSGFTLLFEALALTLAKAMPVAQVARMLGVGDGRLWRALTTLIEQARDQQSHAGVRQIGVDEKHVGRLGFISLFHDAGGARRVLFACPGRKASVFEDFVTELRAHAGQPEAIQAVSMDLSKAYHAGASAQLPNAARCFDRFHVIKLANEALDQVRRAEAKTQPDLRGMRWGTLKDAANWSPRQIQLMHQLTHSNLQTARAWRLKEALRWTMDQAGNAPEAERLLRRWISWARRCRLTPFKRLGATIRDHLPGLINSYRLGLTNATAESINSKVQAAIARARGFRTHRHLFAIIHLIAGKLTHLPAPPYAMPVPGR